MSPSKNPNTLLTGKLVLPDGVRWGGLWLRDGKIAAVISADAVDRLGTETGEAFEIIDHGQSYLMPGLIEVHGNLGEPGLTHKEDYLTGTSAAVAGGVTTVLEQPNTSPPTTTVEALRLKEEQAEGRAYCDYAYLFGTTSDNQRELRKLSNTEVVGVQFWMASQENTPTVVSDLGDLYASLQIVAEKGLVPLFHAEHQQLINRLTADARAAKLHDDGPTYSATRGPLAARMGAVEALVLAEALGLPAYLCHLSTRGELDAVRQARARGVTVYAEAAGLHLLYTVDDYERFGAYLKVSPPVRDAEDREALWAAVLDGTISTLASEHSPHTKEEKNVAMSKAASGAPGIQENLPTLFTAFRQRYPDMPINKIVQTIAQLGSTNVAQIFGLADKGSLTPGKDADIVVLDPDHPWVITDDALYTKCGWSLAVGETVLAKPMYTYLRGELVQHDGQIIGKPKGRQVRRTAVATTIGVDV